MIFTLAAAAFAVDLPAEDRAVASWETLQDGLLLEASGDLDAAVERYEQLVRELAPDDPVRAEALYWLANARWLRGEVDAARRALHECNRTVNPSRPRCQALLASVELDQSSVRTVPTRWDFEGPTPPSGVVHPASHDEKGSLRLDTDPDGDVALAWTTFVDRSKDDLVVIGFRGPVPTPETIHFEIRSTAFDAVVRVWVHDNAGHRFLWDQEGQVFPVPAARWAQVDVDLKEIPGFDPRKIDRIVIQDVTAFARSDAPSGPNELWLDDFVFE